MAKRGALSKVEKYYIEGNADVPVAELAEALDRSENIIQKHLDTIQPKTEKKKATKKPKKERESQMFKVMGRHERQGEKVATVMTKAASELADATRPKRLMTKKMLESIHKPFKK